MDRRLRAVAQGARISLLVFTGLTTIVVPRAHAGSAWMRAYEGGAGSLLYKPDGEFAGGEALVLHFLGIGTVYGDQQGFMSIGFAATAGARALEAWGWCEHYPCSDCFCEDEDKRQMITGLDLEATLTPLALYRGKIEDVFWVPFLRVFGKIGYSILAGDMTPLEVGIAANPGALTGSMFLAIFEVRLLYSYTGIESVAYRNADGVWLWGVGVQWLSVWPAGTGFGFR